MMLESWFLAHPRKLGESYFAHQRAALMFSLHLFAAALACLVHALVPALFETTASRAIASLHARMVANRRKNPDVDTALRPMDSNQAVL